MPYWHDSDHIDVIHSTYDQRCVCCPNDRHNLLSQVTAKGWLIEYKDGMICIFVSHSCVLHQIRQPPVSAQPLAPAVELKNLSPAPHRVGQIIHGRHE